MAVSAGAGAPPGNEPSAARPPGEATASPEIAGIHYQALLGGGLRVGLPTEGQGAEPGGGADGERGDEPGLTPGDHIDIFLPRPPFESWDVSEVVSDAACLDPGSLGDPGPGFVLVQSAEVVGDGGRGLLPGATCSANLRAAFRSGESTWEATVLIRLYRPEAPPFPDDTLSVNLSVSRIEAAHDPSADPKVPPPRVLLVEIAATNNGAEPLVLHGLADLAGLAAAGADVFRLPLDTFVGTVAELRELEGATGDIALEPGASVRLALLSDAEGRLAASLGTLTVQPALLVGRGDDTFSYRLDRVSTTWGEELP